jgi:acylphosphatase
MIEKQAIMYNLAGYARNVPDGTVSVSPHGDKRQIDGVLNAMRAGTKKSSTGNKVSVTDVTLNPGLKTFTVFQWTSTTRNITNHMIWSSSCDQAMMRYRRSRLRACGTRSRKARAKGDDLAKFMRHLDADDQRRRRLPADPREDLA